MLRHLEDGMQLAMSCTKAAVELATQCRVLVKVLEKRIQLLAGDLRDNDEMLDRALYRRKSICIYYTIHDIHKYSI